jgi:hypothetical protein
MHPRVPAPLERGRGGGGVRQSPKEGEMSTSYRKGCGSVRCVYTSAGKVPLPMARKRRKQASEPILHAVLFMVLGVICAFGLCFLFSLIASL